MILLCGIPSEPPLRLVIDSAERLGIPYALFNQREAEYTDIHLEIRDGQVDGAIRIRETDCPLREFSGVYVRMMDCQDLPEIRSRGRTPADADSIYRSQLLHATLADWLEMTDCRVMNRNRAMASNMSKPYQAQLIMRSGFHVPTTLITNDPEEVKNFSRVNRRVIYKSISSARSIVKMLDTARLKELGKVRNLPTQFQAFVPGTNIRVHVVGEALFATEIRSETVDYRYAGEEGQNVEMIPVDLPDDIAARCLDLSRRLNLPLCGIDLKRTPEGDYYCFEVNPSPGFSYYQEHTEQDISTAIVKYLHNPGWKS